jgi:hypothetical protein
MQSQVFRMTIIAPGTLPGMPESAVSWVVVRHYGDTGSASDAGARAPATRHVPTQPLIF